MKKGRCCNFEYNLCFAEEEINNCSVGWVRLLRNEGKKVLHESKSGRDCPYNEFSKYRVEDWEEGGE